MLYNLTSFFCFFVQEHENRIYYVVGYTVAIVI